MAVCLLLIQLMSFHFHFEDFHTNRDHIYRIASMEEKEPSIGRLWASAPLALYSKVKEQLHQDEQILPIFKISDITAMEVNGQIARMDHVIFTYPEFFDFFTYSLIKGNPKDLGQPQTIFLVESEAQRLYGNEDPIGKLIQVNKDSLLYTVRGIIADPPQNSHILFNAIGSLQNYRFRYYGEWTLFEQFMTNDWNRPIGHIYVMSKQPNIVDRLNKYLKYVENTFHEQNSRYSFFVQHIKDIHISSKDYMINEIGENTIPWYIPVIAIVTGILLIAAALFNYINLTLARSLTRIKEIGVRKVAGADHWQIRGQIMTETIVLSLISFLVAITLLQFLIPLFFESGLPRQIFQLDQRKSIYLLFIGFAVLIGLIGGIFPALFYSKLKPISILRGIENVKIFSRLGLRKTLIVFQFSLSLILFSSGLLVYAQLNHLANKDYGFNIQDILTFTLPEGYLDAAAEVLNQFPEVQSISLANNVPGVGNYFDRQVISLDLKNTMTFTYVSFDEHFIPTMDLTLIAGKNFEPHHSSIPFQQVILDRTATEKIGFKDPSDAVGQRIQYKNYIGEILNPIVIGVVENFFSDKVGQPNKPTLILYNPEHFQHALLSIVSDKPSQLISQIQSVWDQRFPTYGITPRMLEELVVKQYATLSIMTNLVGFTSILVTLIACLGLLGIAVFTIQQKRKEMSIRKILGANITQIGYLLSKGFLSLMFISSLIAIPIIYFGNQLWLETYAFRIHSEWWIISISILIMFSGIILTIFPQVYKTAVVNPAEILRDE